MNNEVETLETDDPRGLLLRSWNITRRRVCSGDWTGVRCSNGQIIALQLPFKGLGGRITPQIGCLIGLRKLSLHENFIADTISSSIGFHPNLRGLHLLNNRLFGSIPPSIGKNPNLQNVDLGHNFLTGSIPPSLGNATRFYRLNLSFNSLAGGEDRLLKNEGAGGKRQSRGLKSQPLD